MLSCVLNFCEKLFFGVYYFSNVHIIYYFLNIILQYYEYKISINITLIYNAHFIGKKRIILVKKLYYGVCAYLPMNNNNMI